MGKKICFKACSIFCLEWKFVLSSGHIHTPLFNTYQLKLAAQIVTAQMIVRCFHIYWNPNLVPNTQAQSVSVRVNCASHQQFQKTDRQKFSLKLIHVKIGFLLSQWAQLLPKSGLFGFFFPVQHSYE